MKKTFYLSALAHTLSSQPKLCWRDSNRFLWWRSHPVKWSTINMILPSNSMMMKNTTRYIPRQNSLNSRMLKRNQCHIWLCITIWSFIPKVQRIVTVFDFLCSQCVELWGSAESPEVILDTEGVMYFKQTCIGTSTTKQYTIKNVSRIPLR